MKFHESDFSQYLDAIHLHNLHSKNNELYELFYKNPYHLIIHGPSGIGKYSQSLQFIYPFSNFNLKYQKKITISNPSNDKSKFIFKLSDVHIEIDFFTLGCNSKSIWNDIFFNLLNIIYSNNYPLFFIICKNFQYIHNELHEAMYSYMQTFMHKHINIYFIINTNNISNINTNIYNASYILTLPRPSINNYKKISKNCSNNFSSISSIKSLKYNIHMNTFNIHKSLFNMIISNNVNIYDLRKLLYDILIYNINIDECIWFIITNFYKHHKINYIPNDLSQNIFTFYSQYNNNYRPIYHLELLFLNFIIENQTILYNKEENIGTP